MTTKQEWILNGKTYQRTGEAAKAGVEQPIVAVEGPITLPATRFCIDSMAGHTGRPIDANLAVRFIKKFNDKFDLVPKGTEGFNALIVEGDTDKIKESHELTVKLINNTVPLMHGMTFDRDLILKILSQPKCEGIRLYLCAKPGEKDPSEFETSLVVVGVDSNGGDLYFYKEQTAPAGPAVESFEFFAEDDTDPNIDNESLTGEYSTPPPTTGGGGGGEVAEEFKKPTIDPRFVLLSIASKLP